MTQRESEGFVEARAKVEARIANWPEDWPKAVAMIVAARVRGVRKERGMSAQQLSDRCTELGMPIARSVLANLESGRRTSITLPEILVLARALSVSPLSLCMALGYADEYLPSPYEVINAWDAAKWFTGESPFPDDKTPGAIPEELLIKYSGEEPESRHARRWLQRYSDISGHFRRHDELAEKVRTARDAYEHDLSMVARQKDKGIDDPLHERLLGASRNRLRSEEERLLTARRIFREAGLTALPPLGDLSYLEEEGYELMLRRDEEDSDGE